MEKERVLFPRNITSHVSAFVVIDVPRSVLLNVTFFTGGVESAVLPLLLDRDSTLSILLSDRDTRIDALLILSQ